MPTTIGAIDLAQIISILRVVAGQLDFRAVIRAVSNEISILAIFAHPPKM